MYINLGLRTWGFTNLNNRLPSLKFHGFSRVFQNYGFIKFLGSKTISFRNCILVAKQAMVSVFKVWSLDPMKPWYQRPKHDFQTRTKRFQNFLPMHLMISFFFSTATLTLFLQMIDTWKSFKPLGLSSSDYFGWVKQDELCVSSNIWAIMEFSQSSTWE